MTELHVHLDGSMRPVSVWEMAAAQGTALPVQNAEQCGLIRIRGQSAKRA